MSKPALGLLLGLVLLAACHSGPALRLANKTGAPLTYCPVVTDPPPPHRVVSERIDAPGVVAEIDTDDFNPVFWDPVSRLGIQVQIAFETEPHTLLVRVLQYQVPPGSEGADPAQQPVVLADHPFEVDPDGGGTVLVKAGSVADGMPIEIVQQP